MGLLSLVSSLLFFHFEKLKSFFLTNQTLNSIILAVLVIGIIFILKQLFNLSNELNWLNNVTKQSSTTRLSTRSPRLLKYLDNYIKEHSGNLIFSQSSMKTVMES